jgi:hypothetical protein
LLKRILSGYDNNEQRRKENMSKYYGVQVCKLTFLKVDENGDSIDDKEYEYTGDHSGFCEGIDEDYLEEVKEKDKMKYLVMVSDLVARQVYVDASSREEALENANYGAWRLPEDVAHEEVVDRQAVEILDEEGESK